ncbi:hypothetical protein GCM10010254_65000 [Streptomyces chromofuscus]|nr:hypothetical protein GCM10010254_65000 [Streptomyces chromofuscus]
MEELKNQERRQKDQTERLGRGGQLRGQDTGDGEKRVSQQYGDERGTCDSRGGKPVDCSRRGYRLGSVAPRLVRGFGTVAAVHHSTAFHSSLPILPG